MTLGIKNIVLLSGTGIIGSYLFKKLHKHSSDDLIGTYYKSNTSGDKVL